MGGPLEQVALNRLARGATCITANQRLAGWLRRTYQARQTSEGRGAWRSPDTLPWPAWLRRCWDLSMGTAELGHGSVRSLLTPVQASALWERIVRQWQERSGHHHGLLQVAEAGNLATQAWELLHAWRIPLSRLSPHGGEETAAFISWAQAFDESCERRGYVDPARIPDLLAQRFAPPDVPEALEVPESLVLAGFDELTPQQQHLLEVLRHRCCLVELMDLSSQPGQARRAAFADSLHEIRAAACWARAHIERSPDARIGIVVPALATLRASIVRVLDEVLAPGSLASPEYPERPFNVSLGLPLSQAPVVHTALLVLALAGGELDLDGTGALLRSPFLGGAEREITRRARVDARLRDLAVPMVTPQAIVQQARRRAPILAWLLRRFERRCTALPARTRASAWAEAFARLLAALGWPGERALESAEYQAVAAWHEVLDQLAGLDAVQEGLSRGQALAWLRRIAGETLFQPETPEVPVQVLGVLEAAGAHFDYVWVMGLDDEQWPPAAHPNPLLPIRLQRELGLPHASAQREHEFAARITQRLLCSAGQVVLSHARRDGDRELRTSPLIAHIPEMTEADLSLAHVPSYHELMRAAGTLERLDDSRGTAVQDPAKVRGGTRVFQSQAACPFRAFAEHRLGAAALGTAQTGLDAMTRGVLVHRVLECVWGMLGSQEKLLSLSEQELSRLLQDASEQALSEVAEKRAQGMGPRFRELERERLERLVGQWLDLEKHRPPFRVLQSELEREVTLGGLTLKARIDRLDELADGRRVIIDYKTGMLDARGWFGDRPDEPQLPAYALCGGDSIAAVAFAQVNRREMGFKGIARKADLLPGVRAFSEVEELAGCASWNEVMGYWTRALSGVAAGFLAGDAAVDPKDTAKTCRYCNLPPLCRVGDLGAASAGADDEASA